MLSIAEGTPLIIGRPYRLFAEPTGDSRCPKLLRAEAHDTASESSAMPWSSFRHCSITLSVVRIRTTWSFQNFCGVQGSYPRVCGVAGAGGVGGVDHGLPEKSKKSSSDGCAASLGVRCAEGPMKRFSTNLRTAV